MRGYGLAARWQKAIAKLPGVPCPVCGAMVTIEDEPRSRHVRECDRRALASPVAAQSQQAESKAS